MENNNLPFTFYLTEYNYLKLKCKTYIPDNITDISLKPLITQAINNQMLHVSSLVLFSSINKHFMRIKISMLKSFVISEYTRMYFLIFCNNSSMFNVK